MKKISIIIIAAMLFSSCSDVLTNSNAEDIISDCLESNPKYGELRFKTGEIRFYTERSKEVELLNKYKNIAEKGFITLDSIKASKRYEYEEYDISFTDKSKDFVLESEEGSSSWFGSSKNVSLIKTYDYEIDEVKEVHEIPSLNAAEVTVIYKKNNKTPFYEFEKDKADFVTKKIRFRKTTSDGWKYCE